MAAFAGCTDARNSRAGKVLSILLAGSLSLSFLNITALAAPAYADGEDGTETGQPLDQEGTGTEGTGTEGTENPGAPEVNPTQDILHRERVNTYLFEIHVGGYVYPLESATQILTDGETIQLPNLPVLNGYTCANWELAEGASRFVQSSNGTYTAKVTGTAHDDYGVFVANYEPLYAVTFMDDANNVVATKLLENYRLTETALAAAGDAYEPNAGQMLKGWTADLLTNQLIEWDSYSMNYNITVYPVVEGGTWLQFDSKGGSFVPSVMRDADGMVKLPSDPELKGYVFTGWRTMDDGHGSLVESPDGSPVRVGATTSKLYATWEPAVGTEASQEPQNPEGTGEQALPTMPGAATDVLKYTVNCGGEGVLNEDGTVNEELLLQNSGAINRVNSDPNRFMGWYYLDNGEYRPFNIKGDTPHENVVLYARWRAAGDTVTYQEGENITRSDGNGYNAAADVLIAGPSAESYVDNKRFCCWKDDNDTLFYANELVPASDIHGKLVATYDTYVTPAAHTITYKANYGSEWLDELVVADTHSHNGNVALRTEMGDVPEGMILTSWNTERDGSGVTLYPNDEWRVRGDITLYAQYERDTSAFQLEGYDKDAEGTERVVKEYAKRTFQVELVNQDQVLLPGEKLVWENGDGNWVEEPKTFGRNVGDYDTVRMAVVDTYNDYEVLWDCTVTLRISPAVLTVTPMDVTVNYGDALPEPSVSADAMSVTGWKGTDATLVDALFNRYDFHVQYDLGDADDANLPVGTYPITAYATLNSNAEDSDAKPVVGLNNYSIVCANGKLEVMPAGTSRIEGWVAPAFAAGSSRYYDGTTSTVEALAAAKGATVEYRVNGGEWTTAAPQMTNAGDYRVEARAPYANNAAVAISEMTYHVLAAPVTITVDDAVKNVFETDPAFTGTVTGLIGNDSLDVDYYRPNTGVAPGTYRIFAHYAENPNYAVMVTPGVLTIRALPTQAVPPAPTPITPQPTTPTPTPTNPTPTNPGQTISGITVGSNGGSSNQGSANQGSANQGGTNQGNANQGTPNIQYIIVPAPATTTDAGTNVITPTPADTPTTPAPEATDGTDAAADATAEPTPEAGIVTIDDNATPMASSGAPVYSPSTTIDTGLGAPEVIEDDNNPLGAFDEPICWVHWALLLGVMITAGFGIFVVRRRMASVEAVAAMEAQMFGAAASERPVYAPIPEYRAR